MDSLRGIALVLSVWLISESTASLFTSNQTTLSPDTPCTSEYSCADCNTVLICSPTSSGQLHQLAEFTCPALRPWCDPDTATCTDIQPQSCGSTTDSFICMRDGLFPDIADCSRYYLCEDDVAVMYRCEGDKPNYAPYYQACMSRDYLEYCGSNSTDCSGLSGVKVPVRSRGDDMFAYCVYGQVLTVDRCIGGYRYDNTTQSCEPACPHDGLFPDQQDCTQYYRCSPAGLTTGLSCPEGQAFSELEYQCVDQDLVANCNLTSGAFNAKHIAPW